MDGVFIDDPEVIAALDQGAQDSTNHVIAFKGRKKGEPDNRVSVEVLEKLLNHTVNAAKDCVRSVLEGDIRVLPVESEQKGGCGFCDYAAICRFENHRSGNRERSIEKIGWNAVKEQLAKEDEA